MRKMLTYVSVRQLFMLAALSAGCLLSAGHSVIAAGGPAIGKPPAGRIAKAKLKMLDGKQLSLNDMRGNVVVVNFFAVWCAYSKKQVELLARYGAGERERGLRIIGLSVEDDKTTPQEIRRLVDQHKVSYPVGTISDRLFSGFVASGDVSVPQTLIYGRDGRLIAHFDRHDDEVAAEITRVIDSALAAR